MAYKKFSTTQPAALSSSATNSDTTLYLVDGSSFPDPAVGGNGPYTVLVGYGTSREEICTVTAKPGVNMLTVTRGEDGSSATSKNIGDVVVHGVSKRDWDDLLPKSGGVVTGAITLPGNPSAALEAAPKQYVDTAAVGRVPNARQVISGGGLTGGGDLSADRTLAVGAGTGISVSADAVGFDTTWGDGRYQQIPGAWTSWTPTVSQGGSINIAKTITYAKYLQMGKIVVAQMRLVFTGTGSAGSAVTVTLPVTAAQGGWLIIGSGLYIDDGVGGYPSVPYLASSTEFVLLRADIVNSSSVGIEPNLAVAPSDDLRAFLVYEAA